MNLVSTHKNNFKLVQKYFFLDVELNVKIEGGSNSEQVTDAVK